MRRILITGARGFVGKNLNRFALAKENCTVRLVGRDTCDLCDFNQTKAMIATFKPHVIIHLAADVGGIKYNIENQSKLLWGNTLMSMNMVKAAYDVDPKIRIIGCLSTCIYPETCPVYPMIEEWIENGPAQPTNYGYAVGKRMLYSMIKLYNEQHGTQHVGLIPSNLYGKEDKVGPDAHYVSALIHKVLTAKMDSPASFGRDVKVKLFGTGQELRQFTYVDDFCKVIQFMVANKEITGFYNVATPENLTTKQIADTVNRCIGLPNISFDFVEKSLAGQYRKDVSTKKLESIMSIDWTSLEEGINETTK